MHADPFMISAYIIAFLLGAVVTTLNIIISQKQKTRESHLFMTLSLVLLLYLIFEFYLYYNIINRNFNAALRTFMLLSNLCYYFFIYYWIKLLAELSQNAFDAKKYILIIGCYGLIAEIIGTNSQFETRQSYFFVELGTWQQILVLMNLCFGIWLLSLSVRYLIQGIRFIGKKSSRNGLIVFSSILLLYMLWIMAWDYKLVTGRKFDLPDYNYFDPMIVIYIVYSISVVWIFYKKDPLGINLPGAASDEKSGELADAAEKQNRNLRMVAAECHLTEREIQVLELAYRGLSNPEIGKQLFIAENTVKRHFNNIFSKTGTKSRYELLSLLYNPKNENSKLI